MALDDVTQVSPRLIRDFSAQPTAQRVVGVVVGPLVLGAIGGLMLGLSAPAYWVVQAVAMVGGFLAGTEHVGWRPGAVRGVVGGLLYGAAVLLVRSLTGWTDHVDLGGAPAFLLVITTGVGVLGGAAGGAVRARRR